MATSSTCLSSSPSLPSRHRLLRRLKVRPSASVAAPDHRRSSSSPSLWHSAVTTHLLSSIPTNLPPTVSDPMLHLIASAPPAVSPALCLAACEIACGAHAAALGAASALQLMHAAVHAHAAILRRHRAGGGAAGKYPDGVELMAADGILPLGYELVARSATPSGAAAAVRAVAEMAAAMEGVAEGRLLEAESEEAVVELTEGRMAACGAACGAVLGGGGEETVERMRRFGLHVGMMWGLLGREGGVGPTATARARAGEFRRLAGLELEGVEVAMARGLVEFFWHERTE